MSKFAYRFICSIPEFWNVKHIRNEDFIKKLGIHTRYLRTKQGFTQEQLANEIGTTISQISRLERGLLNTSVSTIHSIALALKLPITDFFEFKVD